MTVEQCPKSIKRESGAALPCLLPRMHLGSCNSQPARGGRDYREAHQFIGSGKICGLCRCLTSHPVHRKAPNGAVLDHGEVESDMERDRR